MKKNMNNISGDYLRLFLYREGKVVLGKNYSNIWLLTAVMVATFLAIAFSNGSLIFLSDKMKDPFINWVDIKNDNQNKAFSNLEVGLGDPVNSERFHYKDFEYGYEFSYFFFGRNDHEHEYLRCRFFGQLNSELISAILNEDNVIDGQCVLSIDDIPESSIGLIITEKALRSLGYENYPAYIDLYSYSTGADRLGINTFEDRGRAPLPVLGVVKRLPGNVDIISSSRFYQQNWNDVHTFNLNKESYASSLCYFVPADVNLFEFEDFLTSALQSNTDVPFRIDDEGFYPEDQFSFKNRIMIDGDESYASYTRIVTDSLAIPYDAIKAANDMILTQYGKNDVHRLYPYVYDKGYSSTGAYLSVHFEDLNAIQEFQEFTNQFGVEIEMSQINAKENFNSVRLMANVLSWAMIAFAIICIILFLVNLLQSYFQKVKRNIGTFKAFGISNNELIRVYMIIMLVLVTISTILSFTFVYTVQGILPVLGILKEGSYNYLSLISLKTTCSVIIIFIASLYTVYRLMHNLLKSTPGDLIYDR